MNLGSWDELRKLDERRKLDELRKHSLNELKLRIMADNYLGKKMEDLQNRKKVVRTKGNVKSLDTLLLKNRSCRTWDPSVKVTEEDLRKIVAVNTMIPCAKNQQVLRFKLLTGKAAADFCPFIKLGALLPDMKFPPEGCEPSAFIIVCSTIPENKWVDIDLGISAQSMLLKATEMGLSGICIGAFNKEEAKRLVMQEFNAKSNSNSNADGDRIAEGKVLGKDDRIAEGKVLGKGGMAEEQLFLEPLLVLALGKGAEKYQILHIAENESHDYFRENGIHYIPKVRAEDLII